MFNAESEAKSLFAARMGWKWSIKNMVYEWNYGTNELQDDSRQGLSTNSESDKQMFVEAKEQYTFLCFLFLQHIRYENIPDTKCWLQDRYKTGYKKCGTNDLTESDQIVANAKLWCQ